MNFPKHMRKRFFMTVPCGIFDQILVGSGHEKMDLYGVPTFGDRTL